MRKVENTQDTEAKYIGLGGMSAVEKNKAEKRERETQGWDEG